MIGESPSRATVRSEVVRALAYAALFAIGFGCALNVFPVVWKLVLGAVKTPAQGRDQFAAYIAFMESMPYIAAGVIALRSRLVGMHLLLALPVAMFLYRMSWEVWGAATSRMTTIKASPVILEQVWSASIRACLIGLCVGVGVAAVRWICARVSSPSSDRSARRALIEFKIPYVDHLIDLCSIALIIVGLVIPMGFWVYVATGAL